MKWKQFLLNHLVLLITPWPQIWPWDKFSVSETRKSYMEQGTGYVQY